MLISKGLIYTLKAIKKHANVSINKEFSDIWIHRKLVSWYCAFYESSRHVSSSSKYFFALCWLCDKIMIYCIFLYDLFSSSCLVILSGTERNIWRGDRENFWTEQKLRCLLGPPGTVIINHVKNFFTYKVLGIKIIYNF